MAASLLALLCFGAACEGEPEREEKKSYFNEEAYQGFFAPYPFGGRSVTWWKERLDATRPGGPEENPTHYALLQKRAQKVGLIVEQKNGLHRVRIQPRLLQHLVDRVDEQRKKEEKEKR